MKMAVPTYLRARQKKSTSKYHRFQQKMTNRYDLLRNRVLAKVSLFHGNNRTDFTTLDKSTLNFVLKYDLPYADIEEEEKIKELIQPVGYFTIASKENSCREELDWKRGRFYGKINSIIVQGGVIVKKTYLTPQGNSISVLRNELGIFVFLKDFLSSFSL